ncbi:hypothetical protein OPV22_027866 [Ensete ventricosum]|uniref:Uncharacterized protein n=1 Tax=Ensete ventricosum TaxID=4639 RepID=A0AAV8Q1D6_ENSVE|nr:hypothetical protein OPV22_027866 [Ensete ventricosum]
MATPSSPYFVLKGGAFLLRLTPLHLWLTSSSLYGASPGAKFGREPDENKLLAKIYVDAPRCLFPPSSSSEIETLQTALSLSLSLSFSLKDCGCWGFFWPASLFLIWRTFLVLRWDLDARRVEGDVAECLTEIGGKI